MRQDGASGLDQAGLGLAEPGPPPPATPPPLALSLDRAAPRRVAVVMAGVWLVLLVGSLVAFTLVHGLHRAFVYGIVPFFTLKVEASLGTWVATTLHLTCAVLSAVNGAVSRRLRDGWHRNWALLAAVFGLMSLDEVATMHERLSEPVRAVLPVSGPLYFAWVLPVLLAGFVFLLVQVRFLVSLGRTGRDLVLAGAVFVAGAAGLEMVESVLAFHAERGDVAYDALTIVEELTETASVMAVVCILLLHLVRVLGEPSLALLPRSAETAAATGPRGRTWRQRRSAAASPSPRS